MQRSRRQGGHLRKRRGYWCVRYRQQVMVGGKLRIVHREKRIAPVDSRYKTRASVRDLVDQVLAPINTRWYRPEMVTTLGDFVENVYLPHVKEQKRSSTYTGYRQLYTAHLKSRCADAWLREVETHNVQRWLDSVAMQDGLNRTTVKHTKHLLSGIFRFAAQQGYTNAGRANPVTAAAIPQHANAPGETHAYSLDEIEKMLLVLSEPAATMVEFAAWTGLRRAEIRGGIWSDIELTQDGLALFHVKRSVWNGIVSEPKTTKSKAPVPLIGRLRRRLDAHRLRVAKLVDGPLFPNERGKPIDLNDVYRHTMAKPLRKAGIKWHGWHAFRRGLATNLHQPGVDDKTIQAILRHSNISTTQNIYIKSVPESSVAAMRKLESVLETSDRIQ